AGRSRMAHAGRARPVRRRAAGRLGRVRRCGAAATCERLAATDRGAGWARARGPARAVARALAGGAASLPRSGGGLRERPARPTGRGSDAAGQVAVAGAVDGVGDGVRRLRAWRTGRPHAPGAGAEPPGRTAVTSQWRAMRRTPSSVS